MYIDGLIRVKTFHTRSATANELFAAILVAVFSGVKKDKICLVSRLVANNTGEAKRKDWPRTNMCNTHRHQSAQHKCTVWNERGSWKE